MLSSSGNKSHYAQKSGTLGRTTTSQGKDLTEEETKKLPGSHFAVHNQRIKREKEEEEELEKEKE